jgi:hypothetical protein
MKNEEDYITYKKLLRIIPSTSHLKHEIYESIITEL